MKKRASCLVVAFALLLSALYIKTINVNASNKVIYLIYAADITKFKKSDGKLTVKAVKEWGMVFILMMEEQKQIRKV